MVAAGLLEELDLLPDELKACEHLYQLHAVSLGDGPGHVGGDDGGDQCGIRRHSAGSGPLTQDVLRNQHA